MNISCDIILDLIPLVKDGVASEDSVRLVSDHIKSCLECRLEFGDCSLPPKTKLDDERVVSSIKKKLFVAMSVVLFMGVFLGMALNKNSTSNFMPAIGAVLGVFLVGILILKFKGEINMEKFFIGRAIGTLIVFGILGIYLLLKFVLHLF